MRRFWDFLVYGIVVGGIYVLTMNKNGSAFVSSLGGTVVGFAQAVTGQTVTTSVKK